MPGIATLGKLFFRFFTRLNSPKPSVPKSSRHIFSVSREPMEELIVRKIIRSRLRRMSKYLVALDDSPPMSARNELIFARVGRDDPGAARRQTINQPSIGRDSKHSDAHRTLARRRCSSNAFLFAPRARLIRSNRLCSLGAFRRCRSSLARN